MFIHKQSGWGVQIPLKALNGLMPESNSQLWQLILLAMEMSSTLPRIGVFNFLKKKTFMQGKIQKYFLD